MWFLLALGAAGSSAAGDVWYSSHKMKKMSTTTRVWAGTIIAIPFFLGALWYTGIPVVESHFWKWLALDVVLLLVARMLYMRAITLGPLSQTQPILALTPALLAITNPIITNETVSFIGWVGVFVVTFGIYASQHPGGDNKNFIAGLLSPFKEAMSQPGVRSKFGVALIYATTSSIDRVALDASSVSFYLSVEAIALGVILTFMLLFENRKKKMKVVLHTQALKDLSIGGLFKVVMSFLQFSALLFAPVPFVIATKRLSIVMTSGWSFFVRKDHTFNWYRAFGIALSVIGVAIIAFS